MSTGAASVRYMVIVCAFVRTDWKWGKAASWSLTYATARVWRLSVCLSGFGRAGRHIWVLVLFR